MNIWENAKYFIDAKKDVDSMMFVKEHLFELSKSYRIDYNQRTRDHFYINCCFVIDKYLEYKNIRTKEDKKLFFSQHPLLDRLSYERNKNSAHIDDDYELTNYNSFEELVIEMTQQLFKVRTICSEILPNILTINLVPHDKVLFRLLNKITMDEEEKIKKSTFINKPFGYTIGNITESKTVIYDIRELRGLSDKERENLAVIAEYGLNFYEATQNIQDFYILTNATYNLNNWSYNLSNRLIVYNNLRKTGILNLFDRPKHLNVYRQEFKQWAYQQANYIWGNNAWILK